MGTKYCDHGAYGAYAATPTWGAAQDGDGLLKTAATPATAHIAFTGIPAGSVSVCGVTVSPTFATNADTSANNLATAINAATGTVTTTGFRASVQLRDAVYARGPASGAPAGTCQVMTRHGSAVFNGQVCVAHTLSNVGASSLTFSGGVSGCWGYISTTAAAWPSAVIALNYGVISGTAPFAGSIDAGDKIILRADRSLTYVGTAATWSWGSLNAGTTSSPVRLVVDDGTEWASPVNPVITCNIGDTVTGKLFGHGNGSFALFGTKYSSGAYSFQIVYSGLRNPTLGLTANTLTSRHYRGFSIVHIGTNAFTIALGGGLATSTSTESTIFEDCLFSNAYNTPLLTYSTQFFPATAIFMKCVFSNAGATVAHSGLLAATTQTPRTNLYFDSCLFEGFVAGSRLHQNAADGRQAYQVFLRNTSFGGVSVLGPNESLAFAAQRVVAGSSQYGNRDFFIDGAYGFVEWNSNRSFPTCNAKLLDGATPWSIHAIPVTAAGKVSRFQFLETPRIGKINSLADGVRTLTIQLAIHESLSWTKSDLSAVIDYIDTAGVVQVIDTYDFDSAALDVSTATWVPESGGQVTYVDGATQYHNKFQFSVTTPTPVATGTEVGIVIRNHTHVADTTKGFFVDPEILVA